MTDHVCSHESDGVLWNPFNQTMQCHRCGEIPPFRRGEDMTLRHHMRMTRLAPEDATDALSAASRAGHVTRPHHVIDDDEPDDEESAPPETRWQCVECKLEGTIEELHAQDCPKGMRPYYDDDEPESVVLAERDVDTHIERYRVLRVEMYERDEPYERAKALKDSPHAEVLRRLGGVGRGHWHAFSKVDGAHMSNLCLKLMRDHGVAPQASPRRGRSGQAIRNHDSDMLVRESHPLPPPPPGQCCIGFSERERKWYGWSHRAVYGFAIGYVAEEGAICLDYNEGEEAGAIPLGFECRTLDDCKRCAVAFAESVG